MKKYEIFYVSDIPKPIKDCYTAENEIQAIKQFIIDTKGQYLVSHVKEVIK